MGITVHQLILAMKESMSAYRRLEGSYTRLLEIKSQGSDRPSDLISAIKTCRDNFVTAMNDDFNTREAIAALFSIVANFK